MTATAPYYVYEWVRPDYNETYYVGKGSGKRAYNMVRDNDHTNDTTAKLIRNGMQPEVRIIARFVNEDSAFEFEEERIAFLKPLGFLTNDHPGGKQPPSWKGRKRTEETKKLQGIAKLGDLNPMKNPKTVEKMTVSKRKYHESEAGKRASEEHSAKLINLYETPQGKIILERMAKKISEIQSSKGDAHHSKRPEVRLKLSETKLDGNNPQAVAVIELTSGMEFDTMKLAAKHFGISDQTVRKSCKFSRKTKGGLLFSTINDKESV